MIASPDFPRLYDAHQRPRLQFHAVPPGLFFRAGSDKSHDAPELDDTFGNRDAFMVRPMSSLIPGAATFLWQDG